MRSFIIFYLFSWVL